MTQINFKIPEKEKAFLDWYSEKNAEPISSIYRNATLESFRQWKISILSRENEDGDVKVSELKTKALDINIEANKFEELMENLSREGEIYEPRPGVIRLSSD